MPLVKILRHGQVTLPKEFRDILGINEGDLLEAELDGSRILLKPKVVVDKETAPSRDQAAGIRKLGQTGGPASGNSLWGKRARLFSGPHQRA
jgi:AbrB family looped-hinge helix DNA binding protein